MTQEKKERYSWKKAWIEILTNTGSEELTRQITSRWSRNSAQFIPAGLHFDRDELRDAEWSDALQIFLLYVEAPSETISVICHSIMKAARDWDGSINKGDVWLNDLLALRRARNTDDQTRSEICSLFAFALIGLKGILPEANVSHYAYISRVYRRVSECTVAELYEPDQIELYKRAGLRPVGFDNFTLFYLLEKERRLFQAGIKQADKEIKPFPKFELQQEIVSQYQAALDGLFDTLLDISSSSIEDTNDRRKKFLELVKRVCRGAVNDLATHLGLQRRLDIHWLRFCTVVSRGKYHHAKLVFKFIQRIALSLGDEGIEISGSALGMNMSLPFKPTDRNEPGARLLLKEGVLNINISKDREQQLKEFAQ